MKTKSLILSATCALALAACGGNEAPQKVAKPDSSKSVETAAVSQGEIRIVGSSTVYPFSTKVAQEFKNKTGQNVVVESTGSGGGHKLFCEGVGPDTADMTNSSRRQKKSEFDKCAESGVSEIIEVKVGFDGIVLANSYDSAEMNLELKDIYLAFAKQVPTSDTDCTMQDNPYMTWADVNPTLPGTKIEAFGPPPTSGTRDAFVEIAMEGGAKKIACLADLRKTDKGAFKTLSHTLREDGLWIDSGENDNAIVQTLVNTPTAMGVFGFSFLDQNADKIKGAPVGNAEPTFENIAAGDYPISRSLYFYIKKANVAHKPGIQKFALEFTSDNASGPGGYLEEIGLVPLPEAERAAIRQAVENLTPYNQ